MSEIRYEKVDIPRYNDTYQTKMIVTPGLLQLGKVFGAPAREIAYVLPTGDPAELHKLTEAIHGRKVAAVFYEDELPEAREDHGGCVAAGDHGLVWSSQESSPESIRDYGRQALLQTEAVARHIEARDAAKADAEREEREQVEALRGELCRADTCYNANAPHVKIIAERLVKAGVRAPQPEADVDELIEKFQPGGIFRGELIGADIREWFAAKLGGERHG